MKYRIESGGQTYEIDVEVSASGLVLRGPDGVPQLFRIETRTDGSQKATTPWGDIELESARRGSETWLKVGGRRLTARAERARPAGAAGANGGGAGALLAPMAGKLLRVDAKVGDRVQAGKPLAVIEAMKMENELLAPVSGVVVEVAVTAPAAIERGTLILKVEAP
jgi:biotin carboxyl carrier protein